MQTDLLWPLFVQVFFAFAMTYVMGLSRFAAVRGGKVKGRAIALGQRAWPEGVQRISNVANNQWESPILFYAGIGFALLLEAQGALLAPLAWAYVATRVIHAAIYISVNHVLSRFLTFATGLTCLFAFWIVLAMEVLAR